MHAIAKYMMPSLSIYFSPCTPILQSNPCIVGTSRATMGYKGILTEYLPRTTVPLKTVEVPGCQ